MKKVLLILLGVLLLPAWAQAGDLLQALWPQDFPPFSQADKRHGVPNNIAPPAVRTPQASLPPLPADFTGTVRRVRLPEGVKAVALTFDVCELQCAVSGFDYDIIKVLRENHAHATFFGGGKWMRSHAERTLQLMAAEGFELGNHAWSHANFGIITMEKARQQIFWTQSYYEELRVELARRAEAKGLGAEMARIPKCLPYFRLPYGRSTPEMLRLFNQLGLKVIQWDVVADHQTESNASMAAAESAAKAVRPGSIILLHANLVPKQTAALVRNVIKLLGAQGYRFVNVSELLAMGEPELADDGYFLTPGDNRDLDESFGKDGTGE